MSQIDYNNLTILRTVMFKNLESGVIRRDGLFFVRPYGDWSLVHRISADGIVSTSGTDKDLPRPWDMVEIVNPYRLGVELKWPDGRPVFRKPAVTTPEAKP